MGEKEIKACNRKGIFSVTQLSYTFRPKRLRKRTAPQALKHIYALQARAIRDNSIYVAQRPLLPSSHTSVYLDVEGDSQDAFYYLIGLTISDNTACKLHSFWADKKEDEPLIWSAFLNALGSLEDFTIYHYGSYELRFLKKMSQLYGGDASLLLDIGEDTEREGMRFPRDRMGLL
jgi:predicted RecB family nuclease